VPADLLTIACSNAIFPDQVDIDLQGAGSADQWRNTLFKIRCWTFDVHLLSPPEGRKVQKAIAIDPHCAEA